MFDANVHLPTLASGRADWVAGELVASLEVLESNLEARLPRLRDSCAAANAMVFSQCLDGAGFRRFGDRLRSALPGSTVTALVDFRRADALAHIDALADAGVSAIKFHSYAQRIASGDYAAATQVANAAARRGLAILVDASYGSADMYRYDNLRLVAELAAAVRAAPIVILHSGGARVLEALLLADACPNVYLETSFTLPWYLGSSVERDLAFAYAKLPTRVIYGSDDPYVDCQESAAIFGAFLERWSLQAHADRFLRTNALAVFGRA